MTENLRPAPGALWAYVYEIVSPPDEQGFLALTTLLDQEASRSARGTRAWAGRLVLERHVARILVVSDSPEQNRDINRSVEAELRAMGAAFSTTVPMAVEGIAGRSLWQGPA